MKQGDMVYVWPHGSDNLLALGRVKYLSSLDNSIAVSFETRPIFAIGSGGGESGIVMMAVRSILDGKPWGPWVEIFGGGHYEIEIAGS